MHNGLGMSDRSSSIVISSTRRWVLRPRSGTFTVSIDGRRVGSVAPVDRLVVACTPGTHVVRVRQGWLRSEPTPVEVTDGESAEVGVDDPARRGRLTTWRRMLLTPGRSLMLSVVTARTGSPASSSGLRSPSQVAEGNDDAWRRVLASGLVQCAGFVLLLLALAHKTWVLAALGVVLLCCGGWLAVRLVASQRQRPPG
jgi:hypothetical protein